MNTLKQAALAIILSAGAAMVPAKARAEGLICMSVDQDTRIEVYFNTSSFAQEKAPAVHTMVISDPTVNPKRQQIAKFLAADGVLGIANNGAIVAFVDPKNPHASRKGEKIGGTVLGALHSISLEVDFSHEIPTREGSRLSAQVTYTKRNGQLLSQDFDCARYADEKVMALHVYDDAL